MILTKVLLRPLKKTTQLKRFKQSNCVFCGFEGGMLTMTFVINAKTELLQDLAIDYANKRSPRIYISEPYTHNNAGCEDYYGISELKRKQEKLMRKHDMLNVLQADCLDMNRWHKIERQKEQLEDECINIERTLCELGCYE